MTTEELVLYFAINAFDTEIIRRTMKIFFDTPRSKGLCVAAYILNFIAAIFSHLMDNLFVWIIINAITIGLIAAQYNGVVKGKLISAALALSLMYLCELGVGVVFDGSMFGLVSLNLKALVVSKLLNFFIVLIISRIWKGKNKPSVSADWSAIALIPISTAVLEIAVISSVQSAAIIVLSVVIVLFLNAIVFYLFDKLAENYARKIALARAEQEKEIYYNQCVAVMKSQDSLRQFRHDMNNQLQTMSALLESGNTAELREQIGNLISGGADNIFNFTGNIVVDGILSCKLAKLKECGADIETELEIPEQTFMNAKDLTVILGNLLDNAVDALSLMDANKYCFVQIKYSKSCLLICIKNTYENTVTHKNGKIITGKQNLDAHGIGLTSVRSIVDKYDGHIEIRHNDKVFAVKVILMLPMDSGKEE